MRVPDMNLKERRAARTEINKLMVTLREDLRWAEENPLLGRHERHNRVITSMRRLERAVLSYGRLLP